MSGRDNGATGATVMPMASMLVDGEALVRAVDHGARDLFGPDLEGRNLGALAVGTGLEAFVRDARTERRGARERVAHRGADAARQRVDEQLRPASALASRLDQLVAHAPRAVALEGERFAQMTERDVDARVHGHTSSGEVERQPQLLQVAVEPDRARRRQVVPQREREGETFVDRRHASAHEDAPLAQRRETQ